MFPSTPLPGPRPRGFWYHVAQSTYVTAVTDWFLGFVGKAADLTLILITLYTGAELLPGVTLPGSVNNSVFVVQMLTLDVGDMGLARLAMQARDQGNETGARQAEYLSQWLIRMVIASLVTVALEQAVRAIPGLTSVSATVAGMNVIIGGALTIARAICAVHYGRVMHLLHLDDARVQPSHSVVEELVRQAIEEMAATIRAEQHQALTQMRQDIERRLPMLHHATSASTLPLGAMLQDQTGARGTQVSARNHGRDQWYNRGYCSSERSDTRFTKLGIKVSTARSTKKRGFMRSRTNICWFSSCLDVCLKCGSKE